VRWRAVRRFSELCEIRCHLVVRFLDPATLAGAATDGRDRSGSDMVLDGTRTTV